MMNRVRRAPSGGLAAALVLGLALLGAAPAQAQTLGSITVDAADVGTVEADGTGMVVAVVEVDCAIVLETATEGVPVTTVTVTGNSSAFTVAEGSFDIGPEVCVEGSGSISEQVDLTLTPVAGAPGLVASPVTVVATLGSFSGQDDAMAVVGYVPGHSIEPDITFPATVDGDTLRFNVTLRYTGNARTMIMFPEQECPGCTVEGLQPLIREPPAAETIPVTFRAASDDWGQATFNLTHFSHYILESGEAGDPEMQQSVQWRFVQGGGPGTGSGNGGNDSPGAGLLVVAALLAVVALWRRR